MALLCLFSTILSAQSSPEGMNYQAVARNVRGDILANQPVALKVVLFSLQGNGKAEYFTEEHDVVTSPVGVFSLVIGKGKKTNGEFNDIPWSRENIWMEVSIKGRGQSGFAVISNSKLLAVPYAYHSLTADKIAGDNTQNAGSPSNNWITFGNTGTNTANDQFGTNDSVDLKIVTNNTERLRILANGNINIAKSLNIGANLNVDSSVYLNRVGGSTTNYGPFTVGDVVRRSPTLLSGTLTVDKETDLNSSLNVDGITDLNSKLNVNNNSPSVLTGTLRVNGVTDLNSAVNVNNGSPSILTGTLRVDQDASFNEKVKILSTHDTDTSGATPTGSLQVDGGAYIAKNLFIGGIAKFGGPAAFGGAVTISDGTESTSSTTGALRIPYGGVGIGKRLNVDGGVLFGSTLGVAGITKITDSTQSTDSTNGAFVLAGGAGIKKNVNIGGALTTAGTTTLNNTLSVKASSNYIASFENTSNANGISIKVNSGTPDNDNNFITFQNSNGNQVGTIEGEKEADLANNTDYKDAVAFKSVAIAMATGDVVIAGLEAAQGGIKIVAAATSTTPCVGLGVCFTAPIPSLIVEAGTNLILKIANVAKLIATNTIAIADLTTYVVHKKQMLGITLTSGAGDYAEYLSKKNSTETFSAGDIVSMKNGLITKDIDPEGKMMVVSLKPIVLGNVPPAGKESQFEKVAFMGQVPVKVLGKVKAGDYIIPSGFNKGFGVAVHPDKMKLADYKKIVGVAWEDSDNDTYSFVNTAVGLNSNDFAGVIEKQEEKLNAQEKELQEMKKLLSQTYTTLDKLVPGFANAMGSAGTAIAQMPAYTDNQKHDHNEIIPAPNDGSNIVYYKITDQQIEDMFTMAEAVFKKTGEDETKDPFWSKVKSDPSYKQSIKAKINEEFENALHFHQQINKGVNTVR